MAYKTVIAKYCANRAEALSEIWTALSDMGWQLHDNRDANSYRIYRSNGENGDRIYQYQRLQWSTANVIGFIGYYYWNNANQTGIGATYSASPLDSITTSESGFYLWIYGNKDLVFIVTKVGTTYYYNLFGFVPNRFWTVESALTQNATSGSNVTLTLQSTSGFVAGRQYQIIGANAEGRDTVTVSSITNSTQLVVSSLPRNYNSGAVLGQNPCPYIGGSSATTSTIFQYITNPFNVVGTANATSGDYYNPSAIVDLSYVDPCTRGGRITSPIWFYEYYGSANQALAGYSSDYIRWTASTGLTVEDVFDVGRLDSGTATAHSSTTLTDNSKSWTTNQHQNKVVIITGGAGAGNIRKISSNTATELTVSPSWSIGTDPYVIAEKGYRYITRHTNMPFAVREGV